MKDLNKYTGSFANDKRDGHGTYTWTDGRQYVGGWSNGKQHGKGTFISPDGTKKQGLWENGKNVKWFDDEQVEEKNS